MVGKRERKRGSLKKIEGVSNGWLEKGAGEFILLSLVLDIRSECNKVMIVQLVSIAHINSADPSVALPGEHKN